MRNNFGEWGELESVKVWRGARGKCLGENILKNIFRDWDWLPTLSRVLGSAPPRSPTCWVRLCALWKCFSASIGRGHKEIFSSSGVSRLLLRESRARAQVFPKRCIAFITFKNRCSAEVSQHLKRIYSRHYTRGMLGVPGF